MLTCWSAAPPSIYLSITKSAMFPLSFCREHLESQMAKRLLELPKTSWQCQKQNNYLYKRCGRWRWSREEDPQCFGCNCTASFGHTLTFCSFKLWNFRGLWQKRATPKQTTTGIWKILKCICIYEKVLESKCPFNLRKAKKDSVEPAGFVLAHCC